MQHFVIEDDKWQFKNVSFVSRCSSCARCVCMNCHFRMQLQLTTLCLITVLFIVPLIRAERSRRVLHGQESDPNKWPFMAALHKVSYYEVEKRHSSAHTRRFERSFFCFCGGVVLNETTILTAAHCVKSKVAEEITVYLGHANRAQIDEDYMFDVEEITMHKDYDDVDLINDIALLRLSKAIDFTNAHAHIAPVPRPAPLERLNHNECVVLGWGITEYNEPSMQLREAVVPVESCDGLSECEKGQIYAGNVDEQIDSCNGDSGGPLLCSLAHHNQSVAHLGKFALVGLVSYGNNCSEGIEYLGAYTYVHRYLDWIEGNQKNWWNQKQSAALSLVDQASSIAALQPATILYYFQLSFFLSAAVVIVFGVFRLWQHLCTRKKHSLYYQF